jgi:hypothetical protein
VLSVQVEISLSDGVRVETAVGTALRETLRVVNSTIDHHLSDVNISRLKLARHALHQPDLILNEETSHEYLHLKSPVKCRERSKQLSQLITTEIAVS